MDTALKGYAHLAAQGAIYPVTIGLVTSLSVIGAASNNEKYHKFVALFFFVYMLAFITINLNGLS